MEVAILTSSRADFGFYKPLLNLLKYQQQIKGSLVVFGTHLSRKFGYTIDEIKNSGFEVYAEVDVIPQGDSPEELSKTIGYAHIRFAEFWRENKFDLILCLGDRYEMFSAVSASVPFNIPVAHISGGEETLGAIDNIYRNALTLMSKYHFTNTRENAERVEQIIGSSANVYYTGSMAIDNINETILYSAAEFKEQFDFDITRPFVLFTFHPETVNYQKNTVYAFVIKDTLIAMDRNILVTMPNADTTGNVIREKLMEAAAQNKKIHLVESLGSRGYYTSLKNCSFILGNSSSGIVEAASFAKYVINIGNRQLGRQAGMNVIHCEIDKQAILETVEKIKKMPKPLPENIYGDGRAAKKILQVLQTITN